MAEQIYLLAARTVSSYDSTYSKMDGTMWIPLHQSAIMEVTKQRAQELEHILSLLRERVSSTNPDPVVNATALSICEEKTRQFLKSDYIDDPAIAKNYMTTEFAALWLKALRGHGEKWLAVQGGMSSTTRPLKTKLL